jgi:hypothetical protein
MLNDKQEFKYVEIARTIGISIEFDLKIGNINSLTLHMYVFK